MKKVNAASRRRFLQGAGTGSAAVGALLGAPAIVRASPEITLRFQSSWSVKDIFHEFALDFAHKVNELSAGRLKIDVLPPNSAVKTFALLNAVHKGVLDGAHGVSTYWHDRHPAFSLFGGGPGFGLTSSLFLAWMNCGDGQRLYDELMQKELRLNIQGYLYGPMFSQPFGWFKQPIRKLADLKGLRFRAVGLAAEVYKELGMQPTALAGPEIIDWLDRGLIDAAEFNNPSSDRALGLPQIASNCLMKSWHQSTEVFEVLINKQRFSAFGPELGGVIRNAIKAASSDVNWRSAEQMARDYEEMSRRGGVHFVKTPDDILHAQLLAWKKIIDRESAKNALFKQIVASQMAFARQVGRYALDTEPNLQSGYDFWFGGRANSTQG
ncbi:MAG: TRAP transporter substrate-binding protein [Burkholderiaceae bacterium]